MKLVRTTLLGASLSLLALGGVASSAQAADNPVDPILCTVTSPDPSTCSADPGGGGESDAPESGDAPERPGDEPGAAPTAEDPLCGVTAGLVCAPGGGGGEEPPGGPGGGGAEEPPSDPGESPSDPGESPSEDPGMGEDGPSGPAGL